MTRARKHPSAFATLRRGGKKRGKEEKGGVRRVLRCGREKGGKKRLEGEGRKGVAVLV